MAEGKVWISGVQGLARAAKNFGDTEVQQMLKTAFVRGQDVAIRRQKLRFAARNRPASIRALNTLRGGNARDRAVIYFGKSSVPGALGEAFGSTHNRPRTGPSGRKYTGLNQFPRIEKHGGPLFQGLADAGPELLELINTEISRAITNTFRSKP